jgi:Flp pilus assembly protein protease CpaA
MSPTAISPTAIIVAVVVGVILFGGFLTFALLGMRGKEQDRDH